MTQDFRTFLEKLEAAGELQVVTAEVDPKWEAGAISRRGFDLRSPAMLFENLKGYAQGIRLAANFMGPTRPVPQGRLAIALGLSKDTPTVELIEEMRKRLRRRIEPQRIDKKDALCKQVIRTGDQVNLLEFPSPVIHGTDGGPYIGTWHVDVTRDPDNGIMNWGMYRHMVHDRTKLGWWAAPGQHGMAHYMQKYCPRKEPMPIAIAIGTDPWSSIIAGSQVPRDIWEAEVVGGILGEPVQLVPCETVDLEVPAHAEIVIEGWIYPDERMPEGEFGEYTGYTSGGSRPRPVIHVSCISHRINPILTMSNMGKPWDEYHVMASITLSAQTANELEDRGINFKTVYCPPPVTAFIVSVNPPYPGYAHVLASALWSLKGGIYRPYIFIVGEDVDVTNLEDVFWCVTTRLHPKNGIHIQAFTPATQLWPFLDRKERDNFEGSKVLFDATFPKSWPDSEIPTIINFERAWPEEIQRRVLERWSEYGLGK